ANYDSALIWLSRVPPASAFGLEAGFYAGVCHLLRNDAPRAEAAFRALIERPWYTNGATGLAARRMDLPEVLNNLAIALSRQGKWSEAQALWEQLRRVSPVEPTFAFNLGLGAYRAGENEMAIAAMREALNSRADDATRVLLALLLERAGNKAEAEVVRAACETEGCDPSEEIKALAAGSAAVELARLERISTTLDLVTWYLTAEGREPAGGNGGGARRPR
ncbi:MAG: tetratricopeptide repeat protein, partial [Candidatus Acidiferrales bacterium]